MNSSKPLSPRHQQILQMASEGHTDKEIARTLGVAEGTLRTHWDRLRHRFDAHSRTEIMAKSLARPHAADELKRYMLMKMPLFIWTADPSGYVDFVNEWFTLHGGLKQEEAIGCGCRALMHPDDLEASSIRWKNAQRTQQGYEALVPFRCGADREYRQHKIRLTPLKNAEGRVHKWIGYGRELADNADEQMVRFLSAVLM